MMLTRNNVREVDADQDWGCAKAFRALGADLAVTYMNEKAKKHVKPLALELESPIFMPLDVGALSVVR
jgi:enoyl-[acyl-carrier-protein] reductase (NADH)